MELQVNEIQALEPIKFNYEELKAMLTQKVETYKNMVYTEETIKDAKTDRASLNKLSKAINDEKIRIKNLVLAPYTDFETKCKELIEIVTTATENVDTQIKIFEKAQSDEKEKQILMYWIENAGEYQELIDVDLIFNKQWLNKSYSMSKVETDIKHIIEKTRLDMSTLDNTVKDEALNKQAKAFYFKNMNEPTVLSLSLQEVARIQETTQKLEAMENAKAEETKQIPENTQTSEKIVQVDFRVWGTVEQLTKLKQFLKENNIKVGKVE